MTPDKLQLGTLDSKLVEEIQKVWPAVRAEVAPRDGGPHEAKFLMLDSSKARQSLRWAPVWGIGLTIERTVDWYRANRSVARNVVGV